VEKNKKSESKDTTWWW